MKEIISGTELKYRKRRIASKIRNAVEKFPVVVITGARQVGKSTMLKQEFGDFEYITMDDYAVQEQGRLDPQSLWMGKGRVILDEAQKVPQIFSAIKLAVDSSNRRKRFILSGSSNLLLMKNITETLAGRAIYFELLPMSYGEVEEISPSENFVNLMSPQHIWPEKDLKKINLHINPMMFMMRGFMPPLINMTEHDDVLLWLEGYIRTYLERDLRDLSQVDSLIDFRKVMQCLALRTGNILNQAEIAKDSGISHPTVHRYIKLLEISNIIQRIPSYSSNRTKRIVKSPKIFFVEPALSIFLSGYHDEDTLSKAREAGGFFETMVYLHLRALCELLIPRAGLYYWRTVSGREVDFVIEHGRKLLAVEVKHTDNPTAYDIGGLLAFMEDHPDTIRGVLVHAGNSIKWLHSKVIAVPWWWIDI